MPTTAFSPSSPLDLFDDHVLADPYPAYAALRETGSAVYLSQHSVWAVPRYAGAQQVLLNPGLFASDGGVALTGLANSEILAGTVLAADGDTHVRLRRVLQTQLAPRAIRQLEDEIHARALRLVSSHTATGGSFDAVALAREMVADTVMSLMGLPDQTRTQLLGGAAATFDVFGPGNARYQQALPVAGAMIAFLHEHVTLQSVKPGSWMAAIFDAVDDGRIREADAIPLASAYTAASMDTTILGLAETMRQLAHHPRQWADLRADPALAAAAFHEALRMESPIQGFGRRVTHDTSIDGIRLEAGEQVWVLYGSTGRDTDRWGPTADAFDLHRPGADKHLAFGAGHHLCAGIPLAVLQARALLEALAAACPALEPSATASRVLNNVLRGFSRLPLSAGPEWCAS